MKYLKGLEAEQKTKKVQAANTSQEPKKKPANINKPLERASSETKITVNYVSDKEPIITNVIPCICPLQVI